MRCIVNDQECTETRLRLGMCEKHYRRFLKYGSIESTRIDTFNHYDVSSNGCWIWRGAIYSNGYGKTSVKIHGTRLAHRVFYIKYVGPIPDGLDLDHSCRNRRCVNPTHLEPVSRSINLNRGHKARTYCENGLHDITLPDAVKPGTNQCIECWRIRYRKASVKYRQTKSREARLTHSAHT
jgi:hypothetical protein